MVEGVQQALDEAGVREENVIAERYSGYEVTAEGERRGPATRRGWLPALGHVPATGGFGWGSSDEGNGQSDRRMTNLDHSGASAPGEDERNRQMNEEVHASTKQPRRVRVHSCSGATTPARLAQDIAARLGKLQVSAAAAARAIAIDGCPSACASRTLKAKGIRVTAIGLHELGVQPGDDLDRRARNVLLAQVVERLQVVEASPPEPPPRKRPIPPPGPDGSGKRAHTTDDYLYAIYTLTSPVVACGAVAADFPTIAAHVARVLSVSRPSAGAMLDKLEGAGEIERGSGREILLTPEGRTTAERTVGRHRLAERFLTDFLDYSAAESHDLALQIRAAFDEAMGEHIASMLVPPARCPHGWSLEPADDREERADLVTLSALRPGSRAVIAATAEEDACLLARIYGLGLKPGGEVALIERLAGRLTVAIDGQPRSLDEGDAAAVFVRAQPNSIRPML